MNVKIFRKKPGSSCSNIAKFIPEYESLWNTEELEHPTATSHNFVILHFSRLNFPLGNVRTYIHMNSYQRFGIKR